jgi:hypothetical protein
LTVPAATTSSSSARALVALQEAINRFVEEHNREPKPFVWTADPDAIVEKVRRGYHALASVVRRTGQRPPMGRRP